MSQDKIQTRHPQGKRGVNISKDKYETVRTAMLTCLRGKELTHTELFAALQRKLEGYLEGSISWYGETVKLDLEARQVIERIKTAPERYRLRGNRAKGAQ